MKELKMQKELTVIEKLEAVFAPKAKKAAKAKYILVIDGKVAPELLTKANYTKVVKRLATTTATIQLAEVIGTVSTNLDVSVKVGS